MKYWNIEASHRVLVKRHMVKLKNRLGIEGYVFRESKE